MKILCALLFLLAYALLFALPQRWTSRLERALAETPVPL